MIDHMQYDPFTSDYAISKMQPPFQYYDKKDDEDGAHQWLLADVMNKIEASRGRITIFRRNFALFKGIHYRTNESRDNVRDDVVSTRNPRMCMNFIQENVEAKCSKRSRVRPGIAFIPNNDEWKDEVNAKCAKMLTDFRMEQIDFDTIMSWCDKYSFLMGSAFATVGWNPEIGPVMPAQKEAGKPIARLDSQGKPTGEFVQGDVHIGDVEVKYWRPDEFFPELGKRIWSQVNEYVTVEMVHMNELKMDYPEHADKISPTKKPIFDYDSFTEKLIESVAMKCTFVHKPTKHFPEGAKIIFTDGCILERIDYPYVDINGEKLQKLDAELLTDIDVIGEIHGRPFVNNIVQAQRHHNMITSAIARNHGIASAPKWMVPKGACSVNSLNNDITIVEVTGPRMPQLVQTNPTGGEIFNYQDRLENWINKFSAIYPVSQGQAPSQVSASVALQFLDEQEMQREANSVRKRNKFIRAIYQQMLERMSQYYSPNDGRMVQILGKDNEYMIKKFKEENFNFNCAVVIQNTSALPDSKAGKIQAIMDLNQATQAEPIFKNPEIINMLDLGTNEAFKDQATVSVKAAKACIESILNGDAVVEPQIYDDFLAQYPIFLRELQGRNFKEKVPSENQQRLIQHIMVMESLMWQRSLKNPLFKQKLLMIDCFPIFFNIPNLVPQSILPPPSETELAVQGMDMSKTKMAQETGEAPGTEQPITSEV